MKPLDLNDLPKYTKWVTTLLNGTQQKRLKNDKEIVREYSVEKWGALLARWNDHPCGIDEVRSWEAPPETLRATLADGVLALMSARDAHEHYVSLVERVLAGDPGRQLIEIGAGYGSVLIDLANRGRLSYRTFLGLEYTREGVELGQKLALWHATNVGFARGDFRTKGIADIEIEPGADFFTSYSFCYVSDVAVALRNLVDLAPRRVLHFEPIFQHYDVGTTLGQLQRRYMEINDYSSGILPQLMELSRAGKIEIDAEQSMIFGANCLLPASLIVWHPSKRLAGRTAYDQ